SPALLGKGAISQCLSEAEDLINEGLINSVILFAPRTLIFGGTCRGGDLLCGRAQLLYENLSYAAQRARLQCEGGDGLRVGAQMQRQHLDRPLLRGGPKHRLREKG